MNTLPWPHEKSEQSQVFPTSITMPHQIESLAKSLILTQHPGEAVPSIASLLHFGSSAT